MRHLGEPLWFIEGDSEDQTWLLDERRQCIDHGDIYFRDSANGQPDPVAWAQARQLCYRCPVFRQCACYTLNHFDEFPYGILAGLNRTQRRHIDEGLDYFSDWRRTWNRTVYTTAVVEAFNKRNQAAGIIKRERVRDDNRPEECTRGHVGTVMRAGKDKQGRQRYRCRTCGIEFHLEEE